MPAYRIGQVAELLGVSVRTVQRLWLRAKLRLCERVRDLGGLL